MGTITSDKYNVNVWLESQWAGIQTGIITVLGWVFMTYTAMDNIVALAAAGVIATLARPVIGWLLGRLNHADSGQEAGN